MRGVIKSFYGSLGSGFARIQFEDGGFAYLNTRSAIEDVFCLEGGQEIEYVVNPDGVMIHFQPIERAA